MCRLSRDELLILRSLASQNGSAHFSPQCSVKSVFRCFFSLGGSLFGIFAYVCVSLSAWYSVISSPWYVRSHRPGGRFPERLLGAERVEGVWKGSKTAKGPRIGIRFYHSVLIHSLSSARMQYVLYFLSFQLRPGFGCGVQTRVLGAEPNTPKCPSLGGHLSVAVFFSDLPSSLSLAFARVGKECEGGKRAIGDD